MCNRLLRMQKIRIRKAAKNLILQSGENFEDLLQFLGKSRAIKLFWFSLIATILSICAYQIGSRISYYLSEPTVVDVFNKDVVKDDMPMLTLCSQETKAMMELNLVDKIFPSVNISSDEYWKKINTTSTVEDVYYEQIHTNGIRPSVKNVITIFGICSQIFNGEPGESDRPYSRISVVFNKRHAFLHQFLDTKDTTYLDPATWMLGSAQKFREIRVTIGKYSFLQRKVNPCLSSAEYNDCQNKCNQKFYAKTITQCRFPFMAKRPGDVFCSMFGRTKDVFKSVVYSQFFNTSSEAVTRCKCQRKCSKTVYTTREDMTDDNRIEFQLYFQDNICRTMIERPAFDFISLLCDIGGNVGLFLGLSCLSLTEMFLKFANFLIRKRKIAKHSTDRLPGKIAQIYNKYQMQKSQQEKKRKFTFQKVLTYIVVSLAILIFILQTRELISRYLSYPATTTIELVGDNKYKMVESVSCIGSEKLQVEMDEFSERFNVLRENVDIIDLLKEPTNVSSIEELWLLSSDLKEHSNHMYKERTGVLTPTVTPFGNCTKFEKDGIMLKIDRSNCKFMNFIISPDDTYNLKKYLIFYSGYVYYVRYRKQMVIRVNSPVTPCSSKEEFTQCVQKCFTSKFLSKGISCSLPFTNTSHLPSCKTWNDAKYTKQAYLEAYMNTHVSRDCNCYIQCEERLYLLNDAMHGSFPVPNMSAVQFMQETNNWEVIRQEFSFPIIKLLCDIGSNLGIIIGASLLSMFKLLMQSLLFFKKRV